MKNEEYVEDRDYSLEAIRQTFVVLDLQEPTHAFVCAKILDVKKTKENTMIALQFTKDVYTIEFSINDLNRAIDQHCKTVESDKTDPQMEEIGEE
jgi:hypothetical protein